jgi:F-type H+-transporting ATPase subunit a
LAINISEGVFGGKKMVSFFFNGLKYLPLHRFWSTYHIRYSMKFRAIYILAVISVLFTGKAFASEQEKPYIDYVMEHIADANEFHVFGSVHIPLPCILYSKETGLDIFLSSAFEHGHKSINGYVLDHGDVKRIQGWNSGMHLEHIDSTVAVESENGLVYYAYHNGEKHQLEKPSTLLKFTSWIDFSISKNVFSMLLATLLLFVIFINVRRSYERRAGQAPKGLQSFLEPIFTFIRDEVVKPNIGPRYERYLPFIMSLFFFILVSNLLGLIPFFPGSANITGNVSTTMALAVFTMIVVNFSANKHYWQHIFWMPGVPVFVRFLLAPIEFASIFIKPFTLFIRLFANITAGHVIILCLVGMVFILGDNGRNVAGAASGGVLAIFFVVVMNLLELFVAFLQAFIFALLSSLYIGAAIEEHHHEDAHH